MIEDLGGAGQRLRDVRVATVACSKIPRLSGICAGQTRVMEGLD